jgi:hypothetical protein
LADFLEEENKACSPIQLAGGNRSSRIEASHRRGGQLGVRGKEEPSNLVAVGVGCCSEEAEGRIRLVGVAFDMLDFASERLLVFGSKMGRRLVEHMTWRSSRRGARCQCQNCP